MGLGSVNPLMMKPASGGAAGGGDDGQSGPTKSLRFDDGSSSKLTFTPASAGTGTTQTIAFWLKVGSKPAYDVVFSAFNGSSNQDAIYFDTGDNKLIVQLDGIGTVLKTSQEFRDPTGWMHFCVTLDSTEDASSDRMKLYVNGSEVTAFDTDSRSSFVQDSSPAGFNEARVHTIGGSSHSAGDWFDGYVYDFYFIDGTALAPVGNFIEADSTSGVYKPKVYDLSGDGSNSFHLDFEDDSDIGNDVGGNDNDFTATNLGSHDVVPDIPTNNFCTLNELTNSASALSEGSLKWPADTYSRNCQGTFGVSSGKWYFESHHTGGGSSNRLQAGIATSGVNGSTYPLSSIPSGHYWHSIDSIGDFWNNTTNTSNSTAWIAGDVIGVAIDLDSATNTVTYTKNGTTVGSAQDLESGQTWFAHVTSASGTDTPSILNFGQDSTFAGEETAGGNSDDNEYGDFAYAVPTGYLALCSANLTATIADPSGYFQTKTFDDGDGAKTFDGNSDLQPDLVWLKSRGSSNSHKLVDSVRGAEIALSSDGTDAEATESDGLTTFGTDGFTVGDNSDYDDETGDGMVAWGWKKGATQGFDIVTYDGDDNDANMGGPQSISHGLGVKPDMILIKARLGEAYNDNSDNGDWIVWHSSLASDNHYLHLNTTDSVDTTDDSGSFFEKFLDNITSSSFDVGNGGGETSGNYHLMNWDGTAGEYGGSLEKYVAYCWSGVAGYSKFGTYKGATSLPYVHLGFTPAYVLIKRTNGTGSWNVADSTRQPSNVNNAMLQLDATDVEGTTAWTYIDFTSNGFKLRGTDTTTNGDGDTYIYAAFAEAPAKYSLAR